MPKFIIERDIPNAGSLTSDQLQGIAAKSCSVLQQMGPSIQWIESDVTNDKIYCVYIAQSEEEIREHARRGGFPADEVNAVRAHIDATTAEVPVHAAR